MISFGTFIAISIALLCHHQILGETINQETVDLTALAATCSAETAYKVFSAVSFIYLVSAHDLAAVFKVWPSEIVAEKYSYEKSRLLEEKGIANAKDFASISKRAVLLLDDFTLSRWYFVTGNAVGKFLVAKGVINCGNVVQIATAFFQNEQSEFRYLDPSELSSYLRAFLVAIENLLEDLGFTVEENKDNWDKISNYFYREYSNFASFLNANKQ